MNNESRTDVPDVLSLNLWISLQYGVSLREMSVSMFVWEINCYIRILSSLFKAIGEEKKRVVKPFITSWQQLGCKHAY